ncbi:MAG: cytochrome c biogenesis protein CcsA [candidate division Zixibacteria bacterium]|nr:cytochrome c biogenesis protein CcsA [Candidatus Tariuqbacter arcticus]
MHSPDLILFWIAFFAYFAGFIFYSLYLSFRRAFFAKLGMWAMILGFIPQTAGFIVRWILADHIPLSNMYEYMGLMSWMAALSFFIIVGRYKKPAFGGFIAPVVFMLMVTASLLPKDISQALMPALQSYWLTIHVTLAALGSGSFAVASGVSFIYLLKSSSQSSGGFFSFKGSTPVAIGSYLLFPIVFTLISKAFDILPQNTEFFLFIGGEKITGLGWLFTGIGLALPISALLWVYLYKKVVSANQSQNYGAAIFTIIIVTFLIGGLVTGFLIKLNVVGLTETSSWKLFEFLGVTWLISLLLFYPIYWILGVKAPHFFKRVKIDADLLEEINYKAVSLGYPLYTVGALFAGAIWAEQAWGQFWSWDPKEVGALIIWLFYSGFLHARKQRNWRGERAAILSIFGLLMILLSFFGNYFFGGQHAYT